jgi:hypothetical protein
VKGKKKLIESVEAGKEEFSITRHYHHRRSRRDFIHKAQGSCRHRYEEQKKSRMMILPSHSLTYYWALLLFASVVVEASSSSDSESPVNANSSKSGSVSSEGGASASSNASSYDIDPGSSKDGTSVEPLDSGDPISSEDSASEHSNGLVSGDSSSSSPLMSAEDSANEDGVQNKTVNEVDLAVDGKKTIFSILYDKLDGEALCGADMGEWVESVASFAVEKDGSSIKDILEDASAQQEGLCSESDAIDFAIALEEFTSCSGLDLLDLIENLPGIKLGTLVRCANFFTVLDGSWSYLKHEECTQIVLGEDPLAKAIRSFYLHPDKNCPCLRSFSKYVPECVLDVHPLPLVGGWMKKAACFMSSLSCGEFLETACFQELEGLDKCLPMEEEDASCDKTLHCRYKHDSLSLSFPESMLGIPLPDACKRIFKERSKSALAETRIPDRYAQFQKLCTSDEEIWDSEDTSPAVATTNEMDDRNEPTGESPAVATIDEIHDKNEPVGDPLEPSSQGSYSQGSYLALAAVMLVAGGGAGALVVYRRQRTENDWGRPEGYQVIELT